MKKLNKPKISQIKKNNQKRTKLSKQGKLKTRRHRKVKKQVQKLVPPRENVEEEESDYAEDLMTMVEKDDLTFMRKAVSNKSYDILKHIHLNEKYDDQIRKKSAKKKQDQPLEEVYEQYNSKLNGDNTNKTVRFLLPVKTQNGIIQKRMIEEEDSEMEAYEKYMNPEQMQTDEKEEEKQNSDIDIEMDSSKLSIKENKTPVSAIDLLACREEILKSKRFRIGVLSSSLLENPELKSENFKILLDYMEETNPEICITVKKLATVSLLEVFKDLLPSYNILQLEQEGIKLKKETLQLQNYESILLKSYKQYLQKLERMANILRRKRGDTRVISERLILLGELAVTCMCELLVIHPYFNFSTNIANFLIPMLDNKRLNVRKEVLKCISQVFKEDKRGELSLTIVLKINQYIKSKDHSVHPELLSVLLSLQIKNVDLNKEEEEENKQKKLMLHKQRIIALSKRERKRNKKLEQVEKELLETKAEENKQSKQKILTEITSIVFTIYFRILKQIPNSKVLSVCLEGLAKFAHCINLEFYQDLVQVINKLIEQANLGLREQLHCIQCVFTMLSDYGSTLNIDPYRFYVHLYKNLFNIHCGKTDKETESILHVLTLVLINRRKRITQTRLIAFVKRVAILALQLQHHGALGLLCVIKQIMQLCKITDILLDTDCSNSNGFYSPEIEEPEYCNAHCSALWELVALQRHYHNTVQKMAKNVAWGVPTSGEGSLDVDVAKLTPDQLYIEFNPNEVAFKPAVPAPKKNVSRQIKINNNHFKCNKFEQYVNNIISKESSVDECINFYKVYTDSISLKINK